MSARMTVCAALALAWALVGSATSSPAHAEPVAPVPAEALGPWGLRAGLRVTPLVGANAMSLYKVPTIADGGWLALDLAGSFRFWRWFAAELTLSPMFPLANAWGYPTFRVAFTPGVRFDAGPIYATLGAPLVTGARFDAGVALSVGATFRGVYLGLTALALPNDLAQIVGLGLEVGYRFSGLSIRR